jgi:hypothetical protein
MTTNRTKIYRNLLERLMDGSFLIVVAACLVIARILAGN